MHEPSHACYDRGIPFFGENGFWMTGLLDPTIVGKKKKKITFFCLLEPRCIPRPWDFSPGSSFIFLQISFWVKTFLKLPNSGVVLEKRWFASIVVARVSKKRLVNTTQGLFSDRPEQEHDHILVVDKAILVSLLTTSSRQALRATTLLATTRVFFSTEKKTRDFRCDPRKACGMLPAPPGLGFIAGRPEQTRRVERSRHSTPRLSATRVCIARRGHAPRCPQHSFLSPGGDEKRWGVERYNQTHQTFIGKLYGARRGLAPREETFFTVLPALPRQAFWFWRRLEYDASKLYPNVELRLQMKGAGITGSVSTPGEKFALSSFFHTNLCHG